MHQKFDVILSKLVQGWQTAGHFVIGSDRPVTASEVRRVHDKGQAEDEGEMVSGWRSESLSACLLSPQPPHKLHQSPAAHSH